MIQKILEKLGGKGVSFIASEGQSPDLSRSRQYSIPYLPIDEKAAKNNSIVEAVVRWAWRNVPQAIPVVEEEGPDDWEKIVGHPAANLVRYPQRMISPEHRLNLTYRRLIQGWVWSLIMDGNGYAVKVRSSRGMVIGLDWFPHDAVHVHLDPQNSARVLWYEFKRSGGIGQKLSPEDVVHITDGVDPVSPCLGCSPLKSLMRLVMTDNQIALYSHAVLRSPNAGLMVSASGEEGFDKDFAEALYQKFLSAAGGENYGGLVVAGEPLKVDRVGYSPADMMLRELARLPEERLTAVFGLPAVVVGLGAGLERSTFSNMEQAAEMATESFLVPYWDTISDALTSQLLPEIDDAPNRVLRLSYDHVQALQEDTDALHTRSREDFKANVIDRAAAKRMMGIEPDQDDEGVYFYQLRTASLMPIDNAGAEARRRAENVPPMP